MDILTKPWILEVMGTQLDYLSNDLDRNFVNREVQPAPNSLAEFWQDPKPIKGHAICKKHNAQIIKYKFSAPDENQALEVWLGDGEHRILALLSYKPISKITKNRQRFTKMHKEGTIIQLSDYSIRIHGGCQRSLDLGISFREQKRSNSKDVDYDDIRGGIDFERKLITDPETKMKKPMTALAYSCKSSPQLKDPTRRLVLIVDEFKVLCHGTDTTYGNDTDLSSLPNIKNKLSNLPVICWRLPSNTQWLDLCKDLTYVCLKEKIWHELEKTDYIQARHDASREHMDRQFPAAYGLICQLYGAGINAFLSNLAATSFKSWGLGTIAEVYGILRRNTPTHQDIMQLFKMGSPKRLIQNEWAGENDDSYNYQHPSKKAKKAKTENRILPPSSATQFFTQVQRNLPPSSARQDSIQAQPLPIPLPNEDDILDHWPLDQSDNIRKIVEQYGNAFELRGVFDDFVEEALSMAVNQGNLNVRLDLIQLLFKIWTEQDASIKGLRNRSYGETSAYQQHAPLERFSDANSPTGEFNGGASLGKSNTLVTTIDVLRTLTPINPDSISAAKKSGHPFAHETVKSFQPSLGEDKFSERVRRPVINTTEIHGSGESKMRDLRRGQTLQKRIANLLNAVAQPDKGENLQQRFPPLNIPKDQADLLHDPKCFYPPINKILQVAAAKYRNTQTLPAEDRDMVEALHGDLNTRVPECHPAKSSSDNHKEPAVAIQHKAVVPQASFSLQTLSEPSSAFYQDTSSQEPSQSQEWPDDDDLPEDDPEDRVIPMIRPSVDNHVMRPTVLTSSLSDSGGAGSGTPLARKASVDLDSTRTNLPSQSTPTGVQKRRQSSDNLRQALVFSSASSEISSASHDSPLASGSFAVTESLLPSQVPAICFQDHMDEPDSIFSKRKALQATAISETSSSAQPNTPMEDVDAVMQECGPLITPIGSGKGEILIDFSSPASEQDTTEVLQVPNSSNIVATRPSSSRKQQNETFIEETRIGATWRGDVQVPDSTILMTSRTAFPKNKRVEASIEESKIGRTMFSPTNIFLALGDRLTAAKEAGEAAPDRQVVEDLPPPQNYQQTVAEVVDLTDEDDDDEDDDDEDDEAKESPGLLPQVAAVQKNIKSRAQMREVLNMAGDEGYKDINEMKHAHKTMVQAAVDAALLELGIRCATEGRKPRTSETSRTIIKAQEAASNLDNHTRLSKARFVEELTDKNFQMTDHPSKDDATERTTAENAGPFQAREQECASSRKAEETKEQAEGDELVGEGQARILAELVAKVHDLKLKVIATQTDLDEKMRLPDPDAVIQTRTVGILTWLLAEQKKDLSATEAKIRKLGKKQKRRRKSLARKEVTLQNVTIIVNEVEPLKLSRKRKSSEQDKALN